MNTLIQEVLTRLPSTLVQEIKGYARDHAQSVEALMNDLLNRSSYSVASLERMSYSHRLEVITSPRLVLELGRLFWKTCWQMPDDSLHKQAV